MPSAPTGHFYSTFRMQSMYGKRGMMKRRFAFKSRDPCLRAIDECLEYDWAEGESNSLILTALDHCALWIGVPLLLLVEFSMVFFSIDESRVYWTTIQASIFLFVVACHLFRSQLKQKETTAFWIPEVLTVVILFLLLLGLIDISFSLLMTVNLGLTFFVMFRTLQQLERQTHRRLSGEEFMSVMI